MTIRPSILCPVDFSDASAGALRYAAAVAAYAEARLIVLTVENPLLTEALDLGTGVALEPGGEHPRARTLRDGDVRAGVARHPCLRVTRSRSGSRRAEILRVFERALLRADCHEQPRAHRGSQAVLRLDHRARAPRNDEPGTGHTGRTTQVRSRPRT